MTQSRIELRRLTAEPTVATLGTSLQAYSSTFRDSRSEELEKSSLAIMDLVLSNGGVRSSGLVLGQVQSGKTGSIIGVISAARDNGFPLVVVASGSTELLQSQTLKRLRAKLTNSKGQEEWVIRDKLTKVDSPEIQTLLARWAAWISGNSLTKPPTTVVAPLKTIGLQKTAETLRVSFQAMDQEFPLLIVDDESDSATPNTKSRKNLEKGLDERSATSRRVMELYQSSQFSKYLMYTATPQANLLMQIEEDLNPDFAYILDPGPGYMGLHYYFLSSARAKHLRTIPAGEIVKDRNGDYPDHGTAITALANFIVGCAMQIKSGKVDLTDKTHVRSMMMQVAQTKQAHQHFFAIATFQIGAWRRASVDGSLFQEESKTFEEATQDLNGTSETKYTLNDLMGEIKTVLNSVNIVLMNSENPEFKKSLRELEVTERVDWDSSRFWVLIGGIFMDRGFTVEGLQVTYMPRKPAINEDSITQRGRFFGYHEEYRPFIRLFMPDALQAKYIDIARNAADLRQQIRRHSTNMPQWIRDFKVSKGTSPTRKSVIGRNLASSSVKWVNPEDLHHVSEGARQHNISIVQGLLNDVQMSGAIPADGTQYKVHLQDKALIYENLPLVAVAERLGHFRYAPDSEGPRLLAEKVEEASQGSSELVTLIFIDHLRTENLRGKNLDPIGPIGNLLWSGRSRFIDEATGEYKYPNDREIFNNDQQTIQVRLVKSNPFDEDSQEKKLFAWWAWINPTAQDRIKERK